MDFEDIIRNGAEALKNEAMAKQPIITLGELIAKLEAQPPTNKIKVAGGVPLYVSSYRGYYSDLAINYQEDAENTVGEFLKELREAVGKTFTGYKGGDFTMTNKTLVWVDNYGEASGIGVTGVTTDGSTTTITSENCEDEDY